VRWAGGVEVARVFIVARHLGVHDAEGLFAILAQRWIDTVASDLARDATCAPVDLAKLIAIAPRRRSWRRWRSWWRSRGRRAAGISVSRIASSGRASDHVRGGTVGRPRDRRAGGYVTGHSATRRIRNDSPPENTISAPTAATSQSLSSSQPVDYAMREDHACGENKANQRFLGNRETAGIIAGFARLCARSQNITMT